MKKKVLFYTDSSVFGGHEKTLLIALEGLVREPGFKISVMLSRRNDRFLELLKSFDSAITVIPIDVETEAGDVFRAFLNTRKVKDIQKRIRSVDPDLVVVSQGAIGLSACGLKAAKNVSLPTVSYLPMAHPVALVVGKQSPIIRLQELCYSYLYRLPDYYLTICQSTKDYLTDLHGVSDDRIFVNYFGMDPPSNKKPLYQFAPEKKSFRIGIIARVEFNQKQHDTFLRAFACSSLSHFAEVFVVGDGPDLNSCKELVKRLHLAASVHFVGWVTDMYACYESLDVVVIPSRFEGLPLVLIEAMTYGVPIVAASVDGMKEFLPDAWLFQPGDWQEMLDKIKEVLQHDQQSRIWQNQKTALDKLSKEAFQSRFNACLRQVSENRCAQKNLFPSSPYVRLSQAPADHWPTMFKKTICGLLARLSRKRSAPGSSDCGKYFSVTLSDREIALGSFKKYFGGGSEGWESRGAFQLYFLKQMGVTPASKVLDVGCGPGRAAKYLIEFLDEGNYCGMDYNASFIKAALAMVQENRLTWKKPVFEVIPDFDFSRLGQTFDYALVFSVLNHCDEKQRGNFFKNIAHPLKAGGKIYITHAQWFSGAYLASGDLIHSRDYGSADVDTSLYGAKSNDKLFPIVELIRA